LKRARATGTVNATRARTTASEKITQAALVSYVRNVIANGMVIAIPNAAPRTRTGRAANGVPGLTKGASDLLVILPNKTLFVEVKTETGKLRSEQRDFGMQVSALGHNWCVWRSIDDARETFRALGIKTREVGE
jgi:hypothetical protein